MFTRKCPSCHSNVIRPLDFKKTKPYQCPECLNYVDSNVFLSGLLSISLALYIGYLYSLDLFYGGLGMFLLLFLRWLFLDKIDALLLPLHIKESHDE